VKISNPNKEIETFVPLFIEQIKESRDLRLLVVKIRKEGKNPGPISLALVNHMQKEEFNSMKLLTGQLTLEEEAQFGLEEVQEHTFFLGQQIDPVDKKHQLLVKEFLSVAERIGEEKKFKALSVQNQENITRSQFLLQGLTKGLSQHTTLANLPIDFVTHEFQETQYFKLRLEKHKEIINRSHPK